MIKSLKSYILLVCTWLLIVGSIVYLWLVHGQEPRIALWVVLAIIALIPLAERLKVGNWFDFTRKVDSLSKEVSSTQREVREIKNVLISNIQGQQQFNISLANKEAAQAFAELIPLKPKVQYPPSSIQKEGLVGEDTFFSEKMSPTDRQRFLFIDAADQVIARATPLMHILYAAKIAKQEHRTPNWKQIPDKNMISITEELQHNWSDVLPMDSDETNKFKQYLESIKTLIKLREDVYEMDIEPPSPQEGGNLIQDASYAAAYFAGYIAAGFSVLFLPSLIIESRERSSES